uniref:RPAP1-like, N-terminal/RPAP1-like, C-terminal, putative n=1 Tax=Theileria annulata TaxID=5874 RepID=A0A3B0N8M6_THEAN
MSPDDDEKDTDFNLMSNDFDIVEHFEEEDSPNDIPLPTFDPCGFPKAKHRTLSEFSLSKPLEDEDFLIKPLQEMSIDEIKDAQKYLYEKLGKETCDFIKERRLKRDEMSKLINKSETEQKPSDYKPSPNELIFKFNKNEFQKYEWMNPPDSKTKEDKGQLQLHSLRFNFEGFLLSEYENSDHTTYESSLYNHGLDPDKPGYTLPEILHLSQSSFKPQVQVSMRTLPNILFRSYEEVKSTEGPKCFFGYDQYRWNNYINRDLDLLPKVGYYIYEYQLSLNILIDSLRCLSILVFGDSAFWVPNNDNKEPDSLYSVGPVEDVIFDYYQFYSGVDIYYWNPLYLDLLDTDLFYSSDASSSKNSLKYKSDLESFYLSSLQGKFQSYSTDELLREIFELPEGYKSEDELDFLVDNRLFLLSKNNIIDKLLLIMKRYNSNTAVQLYCTISICGFLAYFKTPLANALAKFEPFKNHYESLVNSIISTKSDEKSTVHLRGAVLYLIKYLSIYMSDLESYFHSTSTVALIKHTVTQCFNRELYELNIILDPQKTEKCKSLKTYTSVAIKCLTIWAIRGYTIDFLEEFVPLVNLAFFKVKENFKDLKTPNTYLEDFCEPMTALIKHISTCVSLDKFHNYPDHIFTNVIDLLYLLERHNDWSDESLSFLFSLLQINYEHLNSLTTLDNLNDIESQVGMLFSLSNLLLKRLVGSLEIPDLLMSIPWFENYQQSGSGVCLHNQELVKKLFNRSMLPFNCLNVVLKTIVWFRNLGVWNKEKRSLFNDLQVLDEGFFKLAEKMIEKLKRVYFSLFKTKSFYLSCSLYIVKSIPILTPWLQYLINLFQFGFNSSDALFTVLALSIDYEMIQDALILLKHKFSQKFEGVLDSYFDFNKYILRYGVGEKRLPVVSFLGYLTCAPIHITSNSQFTFEDEVNLMSQLLCSSLRPKLLGWCVPGYQFSQLVYSLCSNDSQDLLSRVTLKQYELLKSLLFDLIGGIQDFETHDTESSMNNNIEMTNESSDNIFKDWRNALSTFMEIESAKNEVPSLVDNFSNEDEMNRMCRKLVMKFNSGNIDSPLTVGLLLLFGSWISTEECSNLVWSDESLMLLIGRNLWVDFETFKVYSTLVPTFSVGHLKTLSTPFDSYSVFKLQRKLLESFSDQSLLKQDPVLFITLVSVLKNSRKAELEEMSSNIRSNLLRELLLNMSKDGN